MSMWLSFVRVAPATFKKIQAKPDLLESVFFGETKKDKKVLDDLGIARTHSAGMDYLQVSRAFEAMAEEDDEGDDDSGDDDGEEDDEDDAVIKDLAPTGTLTYDAGYDEAFYLAPAAVKRAAAESNVLEGDADVKKLFIAAVKDGHYVIGIVS